MLAAADILVTLLPATPETANLLDARRLALLPEGARLINPGRGSLIDDDALLAALDSGRLAHATLDVFREEPLPPEHPFWAHPRVTVTPHVASETRPESAAETIALPIFPGLTPDEQASVVAAVRSSVGARVAAGRIGVAQR